MDSPEVLNLFYLSFTSYELDITSDYRQVFLWHGCNVSLLGYNLIILYSSPSVYYYPAPGPSFFKTDVQKSATMIKTILSTDFIKTDITTDNNTRAGGGNSTDITTLPRHHPIYPILISMLSPDQQVSLSAEPENQENSERAYWQRDTEPKTQSRAICEKLFLAGNTARRVNRVAMNIISHKTSMLLSHKISQTCTKYVISRHSTKCRAKWRRKKIRYLTHFHYVTEKYSRYAERHDCSKAIADSLGMDKNRYLAVFHITYATFIDNYNGITDGIKNKRAGSNSLRAAKSRYLTGSAPGSTTVADKLLFRTAIAVRKGKKRHSRHADERVIYGKKTSSKLCKQTRRKGERRKKEVGQYIERNRFLRRSIRVKSKELTVARSRGPQDDQEKHVHAVGVLLVVSLSASERDAAGDVGLIASRETGIGLIPMLSATIRKGKTVSSAQKYGATNKPNQEKLDYRGIQVSSIDRSCVLCRNRGNKQSTTESTNEAMGPRAKQNQTVPPELKIGTPIFTSPISPIQTPQTEGKFKIPKKVVPEVRIVPLPAVYPTARCSYALPKQRNEYKNRTLTSSAPVIPEWEGRNFAPSSTPILVGSRLALGTNTTRTPTTSTGLTPLQYQGAINF